MLTKARARQIGKAMLRAGFNGAEVIEDLKHNEIYVHGINRCWMSRDVHTEEDWAELQKFEIKV